MKFIIMLSISLMTTLTAFAQQIERLPLGPIAANAVNIKLDCSGLDGTLKISGYVPGDTFNGKLQVSRNGQLSTFSQSLNKADVDMVVVSSDILNGVFTVNADNRNFSSYRKLEIVSIPKSMVGQVGGGFKVSFDALVRVDSDRPVNMSCEAKYRFR